jgi:tetratricopeptide (TPR) repeat protein
MARTYRSMGQFKDAIDQFQIILQPPKGRLLLPVQVEAAQTYQEWGSYLGDHKDRYGNAILGARPDEKNADKNKRKENIIWGWGEISRKTGNDSKYAAQFHQARYNLALCRFKWAMAEKDAGLKAQRLKQAKADVVYMVRLFRDLGGPQQEAQYDQLLRDIQKALGEPAGGIPALRQAKPSAAPAVKPKLTPTSTK